MNTFNDIFSGILAYQNYDNDSGGVILFLALVALIAAVYFIPTGVAFISKHPHAIIIAIANTLFGWTLLVWIVALVWACHKPQPPLVIHQTTTPPVPPPMPRAAKPSLEDDLELLESLIERRLITSEEYQIRRRKLLETIG